MKRLTQFTFLISSVLISSYSDNKAETVQTCFDSTKIPKIKTVLILGNSIVQHGPNQDIGWNGDWGMAASARDSDFVHIIINNINQKDSSVIIKFKNIADFERDFVSFPLSNLDSLKNPDMLILKISENVNDKKAADSNFLTYYDKLVKYIDPNKNSINIIVDGFWEKPGVNEMIRQYAIKNKFPFVSTTDLSKDTTNKAGIKFEHPGVAIHPSDKGMRMIADRIWAIIKIYF